MKRVLYYTGWLSSGGAERQLIYTALAAEKKGYQVKIAIDNPVIHYEDMLKGSGIEILVACPRSITHRTLKRVAALSRVMKSYRPDVVHTFLRQSNLWGMLLAKLHGVPLKIASIRNTDETAFERVRLYQGWADRIICNTRLAAEMARTRYGIPEEKLSVIYNAIDLGRFRDAKPIPGFRESLGLPESTRLGVTVARIAEKKNHIGLVRALKILEGQGLLENVHFLLVGKPGGRGTLEAVMEEVQRTGLKQKVTVLGGREDVPEILKSCDFMVLPSFHEGFPNVVLEAMAAGLFVVATPAGGTPELLENRKTGVLAGGFGAEQLAAGIREYLGMEERQRETVRQSALESVKQFDLERACEPVLEIYENGIFA